MMYTRGEKGREFNRLTERAHLKNHFRMQKRGENVAGRRRENNLLEGANPSKERKGLTSPVLHRRRGTLKKGIRKNKKETTNEEKDRCFRKKKREGGEHATKGRGSSPSIRLMSEVPPSSPEGKKKKKSGKEKCAMLVRNRSSGT